ncbi:MAG: hypothetical protein CMH55_06170, partial [Myxococcales bacterium]|nr:hypothetical protein [Myxococcales bacterium]
MLATLLSMIIMAPPAEPSEKPGMAVLDLALKGGIDKNVGDMLNELVLARLNESGRFGTVLGGSDIKDLLTLEEQKTALGCEDDSCLAQLGGALGVPYLFTSSLGTFGGKFILTLKLTSVDDAEVLARRSEIIPDEVQLLEKLPLLIRNMVAEGLEPRAAEQGKGGGEAANKASSPKAATPAPVAKKATAQKSTPEKASPKQAPAMPSTTTGPAARPQKEAAPSASTTRPIYRRPLAWTGLLLLAGGGIVGIGVNGSELGDLRDYGDAYRRNEPLSSSDGQGSNGLTWQEF